MSYALKSRSKRYTGFGANGQIGRSDRQVVTKAANERLALTPSRSS
jgi:hypothetical protein